MKAIEKLMQAGAIVIVSLISSPDVALAWNPLLEEEVQQTIQTFKEKDSKFEAYFEEAYAYAVFPSVGKGGIVVGGAHGKGLVFVNGHSIGKVKISQVTLGVQWGGQAYREVIFFNDKSSLDAFLEGNLEVSGQASAVAATKGASADMPYKSGTAVFTQAIGGLMYEASMGGQKFKFFPNDEYSLSEPN